MLRVRYRGADGIHWGDLDGGKIARLQGMLGASDGKVEMLSDVTLLPPCEPRVIVCVGKNYADHIRELGESGDALPAEPGLFLKGLNALSGPGDPIPYPSWTSELHYEGELALVIAREMNQVDEESALDYVLGYTCACDVTARDRQRSDLQWARAKSADGFCPVGPWLETDLDASAVGVQTWVNGELRQDGNTRDLIFSVARVLSYISRSITLRPGDLVLTGTPEGVGELSIGDEVEVRVEGIGSLVNVVERR
jgi:2-keto-4-pentenoate hydratase/2-oxohepta-3-ene-1,7-dioic acid hydratase in catechol pathway